MRAKKSGPEGPLKKYWDLALVLLQVKPIRSHDLHPRSYEIAHKLLAAIVRCVHFGYRSEL